MKKLLILFSSLFLTVTSFSTPERYSPFLKVKFTDPGLQYTHVFIDHMDGFTVAYALDNWAERDMKLTVQVRTYLRTSPFTWGWAWVEYNVIIPDHDGNGGGVLFNVNPAWQYQGSYNSSGDFTLDSDQYYVSYYGPL